MLHQPDNEQCDNCYFCTSHMREETKYKGFLSTPYKITVEIFLCNRYPPTHNIDCKTTGNLDIKYRIEASESSIVSTRVNPKTWCGEWKPRKEYKILE